MAPPIDMLAIATTRLFAAQEAFRTTWIMQASPSTTEAYHRTLIALQIAEQDMRAVHHLILVLAR